MVSVTNEVWVCLTNGPQIHQNLESSRQKSKRSITGLQAQQRPDVLELEPLYKCVKSLHDFIFASLLSTCVNFRNTYIQYTGLPFGMPDSNAVNKLELDVLLVLS